MSLVLCCLVWYQKLLGFAIHAQVMWAPKVFCFINLILRYTVRKTYKVHNPSNPSKGIHKLWGPPIFSVLSFLCCLIRYASLLGFTFHLISQKGSPVFFESSFLHCLIWYASLLGFTFHPIPQNGWTRYEAYPSFQRHHSGTALYDMHILLASKFSGYLIRNPSILRHFARVHKYYSDYEGF